MPAALPTTIVVNTCDQPVLAQRCLAGLVRHLDRWGHRPRILVADDSRSPTHAGAVAALVAALPERFRATHLERTRKLALARQLALAVEVDPAVLEFGLGDPLATGYTLGANLVAALLASAGEAIVVLDEDMQLDAYRGPPQPGGPAARSLLPLSPRWFVSAAEVEPLRVDVDVVGEHGLWLGRRVAERRVIATSSGICGFTGCADAALDVLLSADELLRGDAQRLMAVLERPRALRVAEQASVNAGEGWTSASVGIDGRELLPPFLPAGRGTDLLWAFMAVTTCPHAGFARLPFALTHDRATKGADATARPVSIWTLLADILQSSSAQLPSTGTAARLRAVGTRIELVAEQGVDALRERAFDLDRRCRARVRQQLRRAL
ncbi:MAG TPA: hypothetical protein VFG69_09190, partial [Nannocystaceae bacterium]|nr:hypothetical protein [Nannocystaceae bacterium]